jgi:beta-hydroxylase
MDKRPFHDPAGFPFLAPAAQSARLIREELAGAMPKLLRLPDKNEELLTEGSTWDKIPLFAWGLRVEHNLRLLPKTADVVQAVPRLMQASFYVLGPRSRILPHRGVTDLVLRAHVGISCPPACGLRVGGETHLHEDGAVLVFDDTFEHEAWNESESPRIALHFDFFYRQSNAEEEARKMKSIRRNVFRSAPAIAPACLAAGIALDSEFADWFRANNLTFADKSRFSAEQWDAFQRWIGRG